MPPTEPSTSPALNALLSVIQKTQEQYFIDNDFYWQGIKTKDDDSKKATGHPSWNGVGIALGAIDEQVSVHTHDGPDGLGYTIYITKPVTDGRYLQAIGHGEHSKTFDSVFYPDE